MIQGKVKISGMVYNSYYFLFVDHHWTQDQDLKEFIANH